jgi:hypothetical protein
MSKGRLFKTDDGDHPPPLDKYFAGWGRIRRYQSGRIRFPFFQMSQRVLRANAGWAGRHLVAVSLGTPTVVGLLAYEDKVRIDSVGIVAIAIVCAPLFVLGVHLVRASRADDRRT